MAKPVILCVDDEKIVLESLKEQLKRYLGSEYSIETVESGEDALEVLEECLAIGQDIVVIISDQIMPAFKGDQLLIEVHKRSPKTLKILLTGQAGVDAVGNAVNSANLYRYISKPWEQADLTLTVKEAIRSYFQDQQLEIQNQKLQETVAELEDSQQHILKINQIVKEVSSTLELQAVSRIFIEKAVQTIRKNGSGSILLYNESHNTFVFYSSYGLNPQFVKAFEIEVIPEKLYTYDVVNSQRGKILGFDILESFQNEETLKLHHGRRYFQQMVVPMVSQNRVIGLVTVSNYSEETLFNQRDLYSLENMTQNLASHFENSRLYDHVMELNRVYERYVPHDFVKLLNKGSILDVQLGDQVQKIMTVLFADIRSFTSLSELMSPTENFKFINSYLSRMGPLVRKHQGFIDKYIGDAIMALFETNAEDAIDAAINMLQLLVDYNQGRKRAGYQTIKIGIGINTGSLMLGTLGDQERMEGTVISDAVNLASRIEALTKIYETPLLISHYTYLSLEDPAKYKIRFIDKVQVKGKKESVIIHEIYDSDPLEVQEKKQATSKLFEKAWEVFQQKSFHEAKRLFEECVAKNPFEKAARVYIERCQHMINTDTDKNGNEIV